MSIDTNIHTKLTDTEVNRFGEIEAALSNIRRAPASLNCSGNL